MSEEPGFSGTGRRAFLTSGLAAALAGCLSGSSEDGATATSTERSETTGTTASRTTQETTVEQMTPRGTPFVDRTVKFLLSPTEPQEQMRAQYEPIGERLRSYVDVQAVELQYARNYAATLLALGGGTADLAETGPFAAALGVESGKANVLLQRYGYGSWTYSSVILTREELRSEIESLADLEGRQIAFADPLSASGSLFPLAMLEEAGLSIPNAPGTAAGADFEPTWSSHATALQALRQGQTDAVGVGRFIAVTDEDANGDGDRDYKDGLVELARRSDIPRAPILTSARLDRAETRILQRSFTEAPQSIYYGADGTEGTDDDLWFSKVRPASKDTYQPVIDVANQLGYGQDIFR